jgi:predicted DNA-binding transcriptional regulator YafY
MPAKNSQPAIAKYCNEGALTRLMLLIRTMLEHPGVGHLEHPENDSKHHSALAELQKYLQLVAEQQGVNLKCSVHTLNKDLAFLRSIGILGEHMYRWGYYLGTGAMNETELTVALNALYSQAEYQRDPLVQEVYAKLAKRLRGLSSSDKIFYPLRAQLNRSIIETDPLERMARMTGERNLFDCLESLETSILKGQAVELSRKSNPFSGRKYSTFQVWPLQILHYDIAWYLIHQNCDNHHLAISRIDRLEDKCVILKGQTRKLAEQTRNLQLAHELLTQGWGLLLGNPDEQRQELLGQLEFVKIRARFYPRVMSFVAEGSLRHPKQQIEIGPKDPATRQPAYIDYVIELPPRSIREFSFWIYHFMGNVAILSPEWLVEEHRQAAAKQAVLYQSAME